MSVRGLRRGNWAVQELERLRLLLPRRGVADTATLLRRSPDSVYRKAMEILRASPRRGAWAGGDEVLLRDAWGIVDLRLLSAMLGRPVAEVRTRAASLRQDLRQGPWSHAECHRLKELYGSRSDEDLEVSLLRGSADIASMAGELCLAKDKRFAAATRRRSRLGTVPPSPRPMPRWSKAEIESLSAIYAHVDNLEVARKLGRTVASVANKANQLGLKKAADLLADIGRTNVHRRYLRGGASPREADPEADREEGG